MSYGTQMMIAYHMFLDYLKSVFGSGVAFPTSTGKLFPTEHLAPGYVGGYSK